MNLHIHCGEIVSIIGPNGAGKSTLFRCILGGLPDYGGAILLDGQDARTLDQRALAAHIAYIPQIHRPTFGYSVLDTALMGLTRQLSPFRSPSAAQEEQAMAALERMGVAQLARRSFSELSGGEQSTTNNRMELTAVIRGLSALKEPCAVELYSDSKYVIDGLSKGWAKGWQKRGWIKSDKKPALNPDLWERLLTLTDRHEMHYHWVKGHAENEKNNRCDQLAVAESKKFR